MDMKSNGTRTLKHVALLLALLSLVGCLLGCGTIHGVGQDIQRIGEGLQQPLE
jgi:predicted small secreted protein